MKTSIPVDINRLQKEIELAESTHTFNTQSELLEYIANTQWAKTTYRKPLTAAVLYLRCKDNNLIIKTPKGKRGRAAGIKTTRTSRAEKFVSNPNFSENINILKRNHPNAVKSIERLAGGSMKAAVKVNCLNCSGGDKKLAAECNVLSCPLYLFNPFIKNASVKEEKNDE